MDFAPATTLHGCPMKVQRSQRESKKLQSTHRIIPEDGTPPIGNVGFVLEQEKDGQQVVMKTTKELSEA